MRGLNCRLSFGVSSGRSGQGDPDGRADRLLRLELDLAAERADGLAGDREAEAEAAVAVAGAVEALEDPRAGRVQGCRCRCRRPRSPPSRSSGRPRIVTLAALVCSDGVRGHARQRLLEQVGIADDRERGAGSRRPTSTPSRLGRDAATCSRSGATGTGPRCGSSSRAPARASTSSARVSRVSRADSRAITSRNSSRARGSSFAPVWSISTAVTIDASGVRSSWAALVANSRCTRSLRARSDSSSTTMIAFSPPCGGRDAGDEQRPLAVGDPEVAGELRREQLAGELLQLLQAVSRDRRLVEVLATPSSSRARPFANSTSQLAVDHAARPR